MSVDGVLTAAVDPGTATVSISYNPEKTSPEKVAQAIREKGYKVTNINVLN